MITGKNYIGDSLSSNSSVTFQTFNPKLNVENDITFYEASDLEIQKSVELASQAFKKYKFVSSAEKSKFLNRIADELQLISNDIVNIYCSETGLTEARCLAELTRTINQLRSFSELLINGDFQEVSIDTSIPDRVPVPKPDLRKMLMPLGPVAVLVQVIFLWLTQPLEVILLQLWLQDAPLY